MTKKRRVRKHEASEKNFDGTVVREYFPQTVPNLGSATATINGPSYRTKDKVKADKVVKENQTY